jgi:nitronate monooxygenase
MKLRELLGIRLPIIQSPMAGAQGVPMAAAVCNAGGLGSLPCAMLSPSDLSAALSDLKARTRSPFNVNFFAHREPVRSPERETAWRDALSPYYREFGIDPATVATGAGRGAFNEEFADVLESDPPPIISFHFGLPPPALLERVKSWRCKILASATTVDEAQWLEQKGVDVIIAQGIEAGGHRGHFLSDDLTAQLGTFALVPQIVGAVKTPVIAAGGIADSKGVAAAMALGAAGVQAGTAFLLCPEATITPLHRAALKSEAARHTALTNLFTGRPARGIMNRIMRELGPISSSPPDFPLATSAIVPLRASAEAAGSSEFSPLWSGQNASGCKEVPAAQVVQALADGL